MSFAPRILSWPRTCLALLCALPALQTNGAEQADAVKFTAPQLEFFEKEVRPLLVQRCYACHSGQSKKLKGKLRLDSRAAVLRGGDTGPAVDLKKPATSLLIDAINYGDVYQMPPAGKLPAAEIATLVRWIEMGLPWPTEKGPPGTATVKAFDLAARRQSHWSWRPVTRPQVPSIQDAGWPRRDLDRFILARLEKEGLEPAPRAQRHQLIRRLHLDLTGLPPTPAQTQAFLADKTPGAYEALVDRLLKSPHFGERWGRHWLDLVRYADSRGHEFDYNAANVHQYRDYVIRALNADLPYDQFVREHLAGDLLPNPRSHPTDGFNESILGTGFWFLGEWVHSPVDIRQDELDRYDNMIDVMCKTFLGLTVSCARCHDHKFDAITQKDYYALAGYLQSSGYRQARFDTLQSNLKVARQLADLQQKAQPLLVTATAAARQKTLARLDDYLLFSLQAIGGLPAPHAAAPAKEVVFMDFESGTYGDWKTTGTAFGDRPNTPETIGKHQGDVSPAGKFFVNSHSIRNAKQVEHNDGPRGKLTSPPFTVGHRYIRMLVGGGSHRGKTCINLIRDGKVVGTLTGKNSNRMETRWLDVGPFRGQLLSIEVVDDVTGSWGNIGLDHVVFTNQPPGVRRPPQQLAANQQAHLKDEAHKAKLNPAIALAWTQHLLAARANSNDPFYTWAQLIAGNGKSLPTDAVVRKQLEAWKQHAAATWSLPEEARLLVDYATLPTSEFKTDGPAFGPSPRRVGQIAISTEPRSPIAQIIGRAAAIRAADWAKLNHQAGQQPDVGALGKYIRSGQTHRTPTFTLQQGSVHVLVRGGGHIYAAVDSHAVIQGPLHKALARSFKENQETLQWVTMNLTAYLGHRAHLEITGTGNMTTEILMVVEAARAPALPEDRADPLAIARFDATKATTAAALAATYREALNRLTQRLANDSGKLTPPEASLLTWLNRHPELFYLGDPLATAQLEKVSRPLLASRQQLVKQIQQTSRLAPAMVDGTAEDEFLLIRGNHKTTKGTVPRRFLEALQGKTQAAHSTGSGRLELAEHIVSDANPYVSRVMVNRIWHHLFGRGIVPSTNNFGVLGQRPSHPLLLDHLASTFMQDGWSIKSMIKTIVLSQSYQMSSRADSRAHQVDAINLLLHHKPVRRLEGEIIRDQLLALSGRLDAKMYGPSVPIFLTQHMQGRGRPGNGPLDGNGRRSIYLSVRRNFLHPMLLTFDMPIPFNSIGRRNVSNVPAQALILMNDPFVVGQTELWAKRLLADTRWQDLAPPARFRARLSELYMSAFSRQPTGTEQEQFSRFMVTQGEALKIPTESQPDDIRIWKDIAHILVNTKEFIFID
jgi:hypothetical protein